MIWRHYWFSSHCYRRKGLLLLSLEQPRKPIDPPHRYPPDFHLVVLPGRQFRRSNSLCLLQNRCSSEVSGCRFILSSLRAICNLPPWPPVYFAYQSWNFVVSVEDADSFWLRATAASTGATTPMTIVLVMSCCSSLCLDWPKWKPLIALVIGMIAF